jgi:prepilin-type processing-associated H-X9-DG protein
MEKHGAGWMITYNWGANYNIVRRHGTSIVNDTQSRANISWVDGHVSAQKLSEIDETVNGLNYYHWLMKK